MILKLMSGDVPRLAHPRPAFYEDPTRYPEDQAKFVHNIAWQREFFHGIFEAANNKDFYRIRKIALAVFKELIVEDVMHIESMNLAYVKGIKVGQTLFGELEKQYANP
jgi:hypothetical protein